jgi:plastocyanin
MNDRMRFVPAGVTVKQGETIRFVVKNSGQLKHEFVLGTDKYLKEHYEEMKKFPEMEHDDPNMVSLAPGKTGDVIWRFTKAGRVDFACLQPGHYEAGMKGAVKVAAVRGAGGAGSPWPRPRSPAPHRGKRRDRRRRVCARSTRRRRRSRSGTARSRASTCRA